MLRYLFPRLTSATGVALFEFATAQARQPHWYVEGSVPDDLDGRFHVLATVIALVIVRLEVLGATTESVALTERFIEVMESEHRELGLGDPTLGKTVRRLVSALGRRVELWRAVVAEDSNWQDASRESLYRGETPVEAVAHASQALRTLWRRLDRAGLATLTTGAIE